VLEGRGGRRFGLMSLEEEVKLLEELKPEAEKGRVIGAFAVRRQVENKLGKKVSKDYPYDLLHRHGWRKVVPRPEHPKADKKKQEDFKKTLRNCWKAPPNAFLPKIIGR
jgi:transposase